MERGLAEKVAIGKVILTGDYGQNILVEPDEAPDGLDRF